MNLLLRRGRPRLPLQLRRTNPIVFRVNDPELALLELRADLAGTRPSNLARVLSLYGAITVSPVPRINYAAVSQLVRIGVLLHQAVRLLRGCLKSSQIVC